MISSLSGTTRISPHASCHHAAKSLLTLPGAVAVCTCPKNILITSRHLLVPGPPGRTWLGCLGQLKAREYKALADICGTALLGGVLCSLDICLQSGQKKGNGIFPFLWVLMYLNLSHKYKYNITEVTLSLPRGGKSGRPFRLGADRMVPRLPLSSVITSFMETAAKEAVVHRASRPPSYLPPCTVSQWLFFHGPRIPTYPQSKKEKITYYTAAYIFSKIH